VKEYAKIAAIAAVVVVGMEAINAHAFDWKNLVGGGG
jgi:type IV secretory pathway VirB2 component (pilin)